MSKIGIVKLVYKKGIYLISGLPRRSYLTARNDDVPFYSHVSRHCEERSNPENMEKIYLINNTLKFKI